MAVMVLASHLLTSMSDFPHHFLLVAEPFLTATTHFHQYFLVMATPFLAVTAHLFIVPTANLYVLVPAIIVDGKASQKATPQSKATQQHKREQH
jgi:hypothetical protein